MRQDWATPVRRQQDIAGVSSRVVIFWRGFFFQNIKLERETKSRSQEPARWEGVPSTDGPVRAWESLALNKVSVTGGVVGFQDLCFRFFIIRAITSGSWMNGVAAKARASCGERVSSGCLFAVLLLPPGESVI